MNTLNQNTLMFLVIDSELFESMEAKLKLELLLKFKVILHQK